jgi:DNA-directed RNA polymerase subunit RPC12/RpoP
MRDSVSFLCPSCQHRLRASTGYVGRSCPCPRCGMDIVVPPRAPAEQASVLIFDDENNRLPRRYRWPNGT